MISSLLFSLQLQKIDNDPERKRLADEYMNYMMHRGNLIYLVFYYYFILHTSYSVVLHIFLHLYICNLKIKPFYLNC
jgi:hypothetical protein